MEAQGETRRSINGQLISVPHRDTIRLLEVYVKRSLSLNDSEYDDRKPARKEKWVTNPRRNRLHSSDPSIHVPDFPKDMEIDPFAAFEPSPKEPEKAEEEPQKPVKRSKKIKKGSFWKNMLVFFNLKNSEDKSEDEDGPPEMPVVPQVPQAEGSLDNVNAHVPSAPSAPQKKKMMRRKSMRRRFSKQKLSLTKINRTGKEHAEITRLDCELRGNITRI